MMHVALVCLVVMVASATANVQTACEGATFTISCTSPDEVLKVTDVMYGRQDHSTCPHGTVIPPTAYSCSSNNGDRLSGKIDGQNSFTWSGNMNSFFGPDPCPNLYKYLQFTWECVPCTKTGPGSFNFCERNGLTSGAPDAKIQCPTGTTIKVDRSASFYGRDQPDPAVCPYLTDHLNVLGCSAAGSGNIIGDLCDGSNSCSIDPTNQQFTDPCQGTYKYVHIQFDCEVPLEPTCCCSVRGDPLIEGFDSMAVSIDVNQGDRCWMADTFNSQQNPDICRYRVAARFGPNKTPNRIIVSFLTADTGLTYQFKIPEPNAGNPALSYVTTTHIGNTWTLTADDPSCQFIISLDVSAEEGSICMQSPDANLETAHQGLCGNCNGKFDDYYLRNGTNVTHASDKFVQMKDSFCWT